MDFIVATDGLCKNNQAKGGQPGAWAFAVFKSDGTYVGHKKGTNESTTNNEMELKAIHEALLWAHKHNKSIKILSDSNYCVNGLTTWYEGWVRRGFTTSSGAPVKYSEVFEECYNLLQLTRSSLEWVKGHSGNRYNEHADTLCNEAYFGQFM